MMDFTVKTVNILFDMTALPSQVSAHVYLVGTLYQYSEWITSVSLVFNH